MSIYKSSEFIKALKNKPEDFYIIHYSCQNLNDDNVALSSRITSITICHYKSEQTVSFSTHSIADELGIAREKVKDEFDSIERKLLSDFYEFISERRDKYWVHWNMRNITYGFEHLEHRYKVLLKKNFITIPMEKRLNLNDFIAKRYGNGYANNPKLKSLMQLNGGIHRDFLEGKDEVVAFNENQFLKMHKSTLSKVGFMHAVIRKFITGKLRTASRGYGVMLDRLFESRIAKSVALIASIIGVISFVATVISFGILIWTNYIS